MNAQLIVYFCIIFLFKTFFLLKGFYCAKQQSEPRLLFADCFHKLFINITSVFKYLCLEKVVLDISSRGINFVNLVFICKAW